MAAAYLHSPHRRLDRKELQSARVIIQGADGTTWLAGSVPYAISRLMTVALPPNCWAAGVSVSQSRPW